MLIRKVTDVVSCVIFVGAVFAMLITNSGGGIVSDAGEPSV